MYLIKFFIELFIWIDLTFLQANVSNHQYGIEKYIYIKNKISFIVIWKILVIITEEWITF